MSKSSAGRKSRSTQSCMSLDSSSLCPAVFDGNATAANVQNWDDDFLFQHSSSDLHLPLRTGKISKKVSNESPYSHWPSPSEISLDAHDNSDPTLTRLPKSSASSNLDATLKLSSRRAHTGSNIRHVSHESSVSTSSSKLREQNSSGDWRSPTPSLTSGGRTTATDTELDTEPWDDLNTSTENETEVEYADQSIASTSSAKLHRRKSGLKMPSLSSLFGRRRGSTSKSPNQTSILPADLFKASVERPPPLPERYRSQAQIEPDVKIIPLRARCRDRTDTQSTLSPNSGSIKRTPKTSVTERPDVNPAFQLSPSQRQRSPQGASSAMEPDASIIFHGDSFSPSQYPFSPAASSSRTSSADDISGSEFEDTSPYFSRKAPRRRKLKRRSRTQSNNLSSAAEPDSSFEDVDNASSSHYIALVSKSSRDESSVVPENDACNENIIFPPSPVQAGRSNDFHRPGVSGRRRPLSISTVFGPKSPELHASTSSRSFETRSKPASHKATASVSSLPQSPTSMNFASSLIARAKAFSKSHKSPILASTVEQSVPNIEEHVSKTMSTSDSTMSIASTIRADKSLTPPVNHPRKVASTAQVAFGLQDAASSTRDRRPLPHLHLVNRLGSREQLYARTNPILDHSSSSSRSPKASPSISTRPYTADPPCQPNSYFTISGASGSSPADHTSPESPAVPSMPMIRRVSLSDLRIPSRITNAQVRIGKDLQRVKHFKAGVEELKEMRASYRKLVTSTTQTNLDTEDDPSATQIPAAVSAKFFNAVKRIEAQYGVYWECCDVLVDLADGTDDFTNSASQRRDRCVSMFPRSVQVSAAESDAEDSRQSTYERHVELLQQMLDSGTNETAANSLKKAKSSQSQLSRNSIFVPQDLAGTPSRQTGFNIRDFLKSLKREAMQSPTPATGYTPVQRANSLGDGQDEANESWDSSSDSSLETERTGKKMSRARTMSATASTLTMESQSAPWPAGTKLVLSTETMPTLLAYLGEVKERCRACLMELRSVTV